MRRFLLALLACFPLAAQAVPVPWKDGEEGDYRVRWGVIPAATARFAAHAAEGDGWRFTLDLSTWGAVEALVPVRLHVYSLAQADPWRSTAYGESRLVHGKRRVEWGKIDYASGTGLWHEEKEGAKKETPFSFSGPALQDIGSLLYGLRAVDWKEGEAVRWLVYDGPKAEKAEGVLLRREKRAPVDGGEPVSCLVVRVRPVYDDPGKDAKGYGVTLWITDDARRLPLRADLKARFGTFTLDWVSLGSVPIETIRE